MTPWREYKKNQKYPQLLKNISVDVAIIGGGMAGVLNAYQLSLAGKKVALRYHGIYHPSHRFKHLSGL
jgi:ribulose 1,5-bisphosphate synthetase/thiazole synthase